MKCISATKFHRKFVGAEWRDLLFIIRSIESQWKHCLPLCHPERSRGIRGPLRHKPNLDESAARPFVIPTGEYPDFLPRRTGQGSVCALP